MRARVPSIRPQRLYLAVLSCVLIGVGGLTGCAQTLPEEAVVRRVIDGDTVELLDGRLVRYLGIDTPEVRRRDGNRWIVDPEPFSEEATAFNRRVVEGRRVRLDYDVQTHDRFGRILAHVYVGEILINAELLKAGLAEPLMIPPNRKHGEWFQRLADQARRAQRGLWSPTGSTRNSVDHAPRGAGTPTGSGTPLGPDGLRSGRRPRGSGTPLGPDGLRSATSRRREQSSSRVGRSAGR